MLAAVLLASAVHELGHFLVLRAFGARIRGLRVEILGMVMETDLQNFPAIVFGFPLMLLATLAPVKPLLTLLILFLFFAVMNVILFRAQLFKRRKKEK